MGKFLKILFSVCMIGAFLFGRQCGKDSVDIPTYKNDTITQIDTIWPDTVKIRELTPYAVHDTEWVLAPYQIPLDSFKLAEFFKLRGYKDTYRDSVIEVTVIDTVVGYLIGRKIDYRLFKPLSIINSTTVSVTPQDGVKTAKNWEIRAGLDASPNNLFLNGEYQRERVSYRLGYDPFNKQGKAGLSFTLFRSKK